MVEPVRTAPIDMAIASQAVGSGYTLNLGYAQKCNLVVVSGVGALTITYVDVEGNTSPAISVASGASYYTEGVTLRILQISGPASSTFAGAITWPRVVSPSDIVVSAISGKVSTSIDGQTVGVAPADTFAGSAISPSLQDQLPASLDSNGFFQIRYLGASDVPNRGWTLGGTDVPSRSWTLGSSDHAVPYGSAGKSLLQDTLGNLQHVPVLQGTSTPISTKALQYDQNNYPLHSIGNVVAGGNGGDTVVGGTYFYNGTGPVGTLGTTTVYTGPSGYRVIIDALEIVVANNSTTDPSSKVSFNGYVKLFLTAYGFNVAPGRTGTYYTVLDDSSGYYVGTTVGSTLNEIWDTHPQSLLVGTYSPNNAYTKVTNPANSGPASGDTTVLNTPLLVLPGDQLQAQLQWSGGSSNTNFLAYLYLHGHTEVL